MAARRKPSAKKKRTRRKGSRTPAAVKRVAAARPKKRVSSKKRAATRLKPKKRVAARPKKRVPARPKPKKRAVAPRPKARAKPKKRVVTPAQRAAITRTLRVFAALASPREYTRAAQKDIYRVKRSALISALVKAGFSSASIRARLGWITRRRNLFREDIATRRVIILGTTLLHGSDPDQRRILETMIRERDGRFLRFTQEMKKMTLEWSEIINEWFSPKVQSA